MSAKRHLAKDRKWTKITTYTQNTTEFKGPQQDHSWRLLKPNEHQSELYIMGVFITGHLFYIERFSVFFKPPFLK